jgi:hypothetical protein
MWEICSYQFYSLENRIKPWKLLKSVNLKYALSIQNFVLETLLILFLRHLHLWVEIPVDCYHVFYSKPFFSWELLANHVTPIGIAKFKHDLFGHRWWMDLVVCLSGFHWPSNEGIIVNPLVDVTQQAWHHWLCILCHAEDITWSFGGVKPTGREIQLKVEEINSDSLEIPRFCCLYSLATCLPCLNLGHIR